MTWVLYLVALGQCSIRENNQTIPPYRTEFMDHVKTIPASSHHRRSITNPPILYMNLDTTTLTPAQIHSVALAYKFMSLVYNAGTSINISVRASSSVISTGDNSYLVGTAESSTNTITLYTSKIPNDDALMIVTLHEMFHLFGFSTSHEEGSESFVSRVNEYTNVYESASVDDCLGNKAPALVTNDRVHWNASHGYFKDDTMLPTIHFGTTATSKCTIKAVLESRGSWTDNLCASDAACSNGKTCRRIGPHWINVCQAPPLPPSPPAPYEATLVMFVYLSCIVTLMVGTRACHRRRVKS